MKWNIEDLPVFLALYETQGVRAAAARLHMPKSTVSRRLARLEEKLDLRLIDRNPLRSGALVQICPAIIPEPRAQIVALTASRRLYPQKMRVFVDFAKQCVRDYQSFGVD